MSIATAFNAALAIVENRNQDAIDMLGCFLGTEELPNLSFVIEFARRLNEAVKDRLIVEAQELLENILLEEAVTPFPEEALDLPNSDLVHYLAGRRDALKHFEDKLEDLRTQTKPKPEYEPVDFPE